MQGWGWTSGGSRNPCYKLPTGCGLNRSPSSPAHRLNRGNEPCDPSNPVPLATRPRSRRLPGFPWRTFRSQKPARNRPRRLRIACPRHHPVRTAVAHCHSSRPRRILHLGIRRRARSHVHDLHRHRAGSPAVQPARLRLSILKVWRGRQCGAGALARVQVAALRAWDNRPRLSSGATHPQRLREGHGRAGRISPLFQKEVAPTLGLYSRVGTSISAKRRASSDFTSGCPAVVETLVAHPCTQGWGNLACTKSGPAMALGLRARS